MTKPGDLCLLGKCSASELNPLSQSNLLYQTSQFQTKKPWPRDGQLAQGHTTASHISLLTIYFPGKGWTRPRDEAVIVVGEDITQFLRLGNLEGTGIYFSLLFFGVVGECVHMCVYMFVCVHVHADSRSCPPMASSAVLHLFIYLFFLRQCLSLNLEFTDSARLVGYCAPGIHLSLSTKELELRMHAVASDCVQVLGSELSS